MGRTLWPVAAWLPIVLACSGGGGSPGADSAGADGSVSDLLADGLAKDGDSSKPSGDIAEAEGAADVLPVPDAPSDGRAEIVPPVCMEGTGGSPILADPDETFDLGPYLMSPTPTAMTVMWRTLDAADGLVLFGKGDALDRQATHPGEATVHEVVLEELEPATRYAYRVESGGIQSKVHHFTTAPDAVQPVRFAHFADNQNGPEIFAQHVLAMAAWGPHLLVGSGDHVQAGLDEPLWKEQLFGPARGLLHQVPVQLVVGNHEENSPFYYQLMANPHPADHPEWESHFGFRYGNTYFLVINTNYFLCPIGEVELPDGQHMRELAESPEAQSATWRIALGHENAWSECWGDGDCGYDGTLCLRNYVVPLLADRGFHFYLAGHTHAYERGQAANMVHVIAGGGGGSMDAWCKDWPQTSVVHTAHHHLRFEAGCQTLRMEAVDLDGNIFDWVELDKDAPGVLQDQGPIPDLPPPTLNSDR
ncbi:MAG: hypothetical protein FJ109_13065 [Deltaproteobacteria bacterium]|nr:hypothetical protein [Deltaproteobacteria bacterium]